jgi:hypothetical protein
MDFSISIKPQRRNTAPPFGSAEIAALRLEEHMAPSYQLEVRPMTRLDRLQPADLDRLMADEPLSDVERDRIRWAMMSDEEKQTERKIWAAIGRLVTRRRA